MVAIETNTADRLERAPLIRTLRQKACPASAAWLNRAAVEVNQVWSFANATSAKAARPFAGPPKWLTGYDLCNLSAGACHEFECIGADTIQRVNREYATKRRQARKPRLRWRVPAARASTVVLASVMRKSPARWQRAR